MNASILSLALVTVLGAGLSDSPRKPNPFAPSLPQLSDDEEDKLDQIIDRFILQDTGHLLGEEGKRARQDFDKLGPEAIPALIRGINRAAKIEHSCPAVVIARKLGRMLNASSDTELLDYARENIGAGVGRTRHQVVLKDLRVMCMLRKSEVMRGGATRTINPAGEWAPRSMSMKELTEAVQKERGAKLKDVVNELGRRKGEEVIAALGAAANSYEEDIQKLARTQLNKQLSALAPEVLKDKLQDDRAEVRAAAARVIGEKKMRLGNELIDLLTDEYDQVRDAAHQALVKMNRGADLGPAKDAGDTERKDAQKKWREWWLRQGGQ
jgi:hypothetical protein